MKLKEKFLTISFFSLFILIVSCSGNEELENDQTLDDYPSIISIEVNGEEYYSGFTTTFKTENIISIPNGAVIKFDASGRFGYFNIKLPTSGPSSIDRNFYSFKFFSSNFFNFNLETVDEVNKRVKGTFDGYLFADSADLTSESKYVRGSFDLKYVELVPSVFNLKNQAKINGTEWVKIRDESTIIPIGSLSKNYTHHDYDDNEYRISINYNLPNGVSFLNETIYNFTNTDISNNVKLAKYDIISNTLVNYKTSGQLTITKYENSIMYGTYFFTAVNPNNPSDIIQVTDGDFKLITNSN
ncbi:MAG: hypothetical protein Q8K02_15250 [Flavobacterium sp.]|nr:hypothetical protein [Flavobacterium sp.]